VPQPVPAVHRDRHPLSDPGPVFFRQPRVGHEGRTFRVWKFRTMYVDAEERKATLEELNESDGMMFKMKEDPRIFSLRQQAARHLDGRAAPADQRAEGRDVAGRPRPLPAEDGDYLGDVRRRLLVRPA
jgi:hypothetical protein